MAQPTTIKKEASKPKWLTETVEALEEERCGSWANLLGQALNDAWHSGNNLGHTLINMGSMADKENLARLQRAFPDPYTLREMEPIRRVDRLLSEFHEQMREARTLADLDDVILTVGA